MGLLEGRGDMPQNHDTKTNLQLLWGHCRDDETLPLLDRFCEPHHPDGSGSLS